MSDPLKKVIGYGWSGVYCEGEHRLGWMLSRFVAHNQADALDADQLRALGVYTKGMRDIAPSHMYRVKITIEVVRNKRGNPITRHTKRKE